MEARSEPTTSSGSSPAPGQSRRLDESTSTRPLKRQRSEHDSEYGEAWSDWPAPASSMHEARKFILDIVDNHRSVVIVPDKDADGLSAGTLLYKTLRLLGHPASLIKVHHLRKGSNVCNENERLALEASGAEKAVVLDQGSRAGDALLPLASTKRVLIIDHHLSTEVRLVFTRTAEVSFHKGPRS